MVHDYSTGSYAPSPVPSDARLWPLELPFTAFGHLGEDMLDLRVFDQEVYWVDRIGTPHLVLQMSRDYIENVITFLVDLREQYFTDSQRRAIFRHLAINSCSMRREARSWRPQQGHHPGPS